MGRKTKDKKKGKGAEKTATKTDKKFVAKQKKMLAKIGEADIESIISQYETEENKRKTVTEIVATPPTPRANWSLCSHPDKDELVFFGGEYFNGQKTCVYNDLYFYNILKNEWKLIKAPSGPTPRSGHQMVSVATDGGQLWLFGGDYASPSQLQFYHYRDLWVFRMVSKTWEKIQAINGPSARSGHRMIVSKKKLFVFGGFHDNNQNYKYFNDIFMFSLENYTWQEIKPSGVVIPPPRSGCCMSSTTDGKILVWGGYSKANVKKEVDRGVTHTDAYALIQDKHDATGNTWKWNTIKPSGIRPSPRSGVCNAVSPNGKSYVFGGVMDTEEDEEILQGLFSNQLHVIDLNSYVWRLVELATKKDKIKAKEENVVAKEEAESKTVTNDGVFTMVVGAVNASSSGTNKSVKEVVPLNGPSPRMNSVSIIHKGVYYLFGGLVEEGSKQFTLCDFYSLDLHKLDEWKTIIPNNLTTMEWLGSDSESSSSEDDSSDDDDDDDSDSDSEMDTE